MNPSPAFIVYTVSLLLAAASLMLLIIRFLMNTGRKPAERTSIQQRPVSRSGGFFIFLLLFGLFIAGYYVLRYHGLWMESDTARITLSIESMREQAVLLPTRFFYQHGFGYQAVTLALVYTTGLSIQTLQTILYPFLGVAGFILLSFFFFQEVLRDYRAAALASLLLIFDPYILFVIMRGSHEKMTWPLMMVALAFIYRSVGQPIRKMAIFIGLFYFVVFAIDTTNVFFGSVFLIAVILSMALGFVLFRFWRNKRPPLPRKDVQRLMYISMSGAILIFITIAYVYTPTLGNLRVLQGILEQISVLLLSFEINAQPYDYISIGWITPQIYLLLSAFSWIVIAASFLVWLRKGIRMFHGETARGLVENLDWLLYTGFAIQIVVSILVDLSGALSANMQLRLFPSFTVLAIVLLVRFLKQAFSHSKLPILTRRIVLGLSAALSIWFTLASVLKATNEPSLSNKWSFYLPSEKSSILWMDTHLHQAFIWTGVDERLATIFTSYFALDSKSGNYYLYGKINPNTRYVLVSELDRLRAERSGIQLLPVSYWDQIYDNGQERVNRISLYILKDF